MNALAPAHSVRRPAQELEQFAATLFAAAGLDIGKADCVARLLILTDMLGRATHGLAQAPPTSRRSPSAT